MTARALLTLGNPKTAKGEGYGYLTAILHLAPASLASWEEQRINVCPNASPQCIALCLNTAGRGGIFRKGETTNAIQDARIRKTREFFADRSAFLARLAKEIAAHVRRARRNGLRPAVRLNGTSDLAWEGFALTLFEDFPDVVFYDYTKSARRMQAYLAGDFPRNYSLTFSRSEENAEEVIAVLEAGGNVAVAFDTKRGARLPESWAGIPVLDGDITDLRFTDTRGAIVGLRAKGRGRRAEYRGGFVVATEGK